LSRPAILWLHGGAYAIGDRKYMREMMKFTASLGYVSASSDYRLLPNANMDDIYQDGQDAFFYLKNNCQKLLIDPNRITIGGDSAGGHLALLIGLRTEGVNAIIDLYGPTDLERLYRQSARTWKEVAIALVMGKTPEEDPDLWYRSSPVNLVTKGSPPVLILHGTNDGVIPFEQASILKDALYSCEARYVYAPVKDAPHGWVLDNWGTISLRTTSIIAQFLRQENLQWDYSK